MSAVWPLADSRARRSAPRASSRRTAAVLPARAAVMSTVSPPGSAVLTPAPATSRRSIIAALPLVAASAIGVTP